MPQGHGLCTRVCQSSNCSQGNVVLGEIGHTVLCQGSCSSSIRGDATETQGWIQEFPKGGGGGANGNAWRMHGCGSGKGASEAFTMCVLNVCS